MRLSQDNTPFPSLACRVPQLLERSLQLVSSVLLVIAWPSSFTPKSVQNKSDGAVAHLQPLSPSSFSSPSQLAPVVTTGRSGQMVGSVMGGAMFVQLQVLICRGCLDTWHSVENDVFWGRKRPKGWNVFFSMSLLVQSQAKSGVFSRLTGDCHALPCTAMHLHRGWDQTRSNGF